MAEHRQQIQRRQRVYRQRRDIFNEYNDDELIKRFRMNRAGIITVADLVNRQRRDIFNEYNDNELIKRFRMNRAGIITVTDLVRDRLQSRTERNRPLSPETKVAITLRYLATGKMQQ